MNSLSRDTQGKPPPDLIRNITENESIDKCSDKSILTDSSKTKAEPSWTTQPPGVLVGPDEDNDPAYRRKKRRRKVKRGFGWAFWILCAPCAFIANKLRDSPVDDDDLQDDPLRPWYYNVKYGITSR